MNSDKTRRQEGVRKAWANEREHVRQGNGTRDWTPEQQKAILDGKTPKDDQGVSYEGHHMKSVDKYPKHAANPSDIQFLSKKEHLDAHNKDFHNQTNGYYNPDTGKTESFGNRLPASPEAKSLSSPVASESQGQGQSAGQTSSGSQSSGQNSGDSGGGKSAGQSK